MRRESIISNVCFNVVGVMEGSGMRLFLTLGSSTLPQWRRESRWPSIFLTTSSTCIMIWSFFQLRMARSRFVGLTALSKT